MSWLALNRSEELFALLGSDLKAFGLLTVIAARARYQSDPCPITNLRHGEARIGDYESCGLTRKEYRNALTRLEKMSIISTKRASTGTIAKLCNSSIYSISGEQEGQQRANEGPTKGQPGATNNKVTRKEGNTSPDLFVMDSEIPEEKPKKPRFNPMTTRIKNRTPEMDLIGGCFGKPEEVIWTTLESQLLKALTPTLEEIELIVDFYSYEIPETNGYRNRNVKTLLQNWSAQLISAREFFKQNPDLKTA